MRTIQMSFVIAVALGLFVAWSGALPTKLSTDDIIRGGCWICVECDHAICKDWPGAELCGNIGPYRIECTEQRNPYAYEYIPCSWMDVAPCLELPGCDFQTCKSCP